MVEPALAAPVATAAATDLTPYTYPAATLVLAAAPAETCWKSAAEGQGRSRIRIYNRTVPLKHFRAVYLACEKKREGRHIEPGGRETQTGKNGTSQSLHAAASAYEWQVPLGSAGVVNDVSAVKEFIQSTV